MDKDFRWSVTALKTLGSCGKKFHWAYLQEEVTETPSLHLVFGKVIHQVIDVIQKENRWLTNQWMRDWARLWQEGIKDLLLATYRELSIYEKLGPELLAKYAEEKSNRKANVLVSEWDFREENYDLQGWLLSGIIDQVREHDGELTLLDFKTSKRPPDPLLLRTDPQFTIYAFVCFLKYGTWPKVGWYHLRTGEIHYTERNFDDLWPVAAMLTEANLRVENKLLTRNLGYACTNCGFKKPCLEGIIQGS